MTRSVVTKRAHAGRAAALCGVFALSMSGFMGSCAIDDGSASNAPSDPGELESISQALTTNNAPIKGVPSGRCLDVKHNVQTLGTPLQIYDCNGGPNQAFSFTAAGELRVYNNAFCIQSKNGTPNGVDPAVIATCNGQKTQQWHLDSQQRIVSSDNAWCLDVYQALTANQTQVTPYWCGTQSNQKWTTAGGDAQAPSSPTGLALSNVTCNSATLSWKASSDNVGVAFYDIYHDGQLMKSVAGNVLSTSITLTPGASWSLYISARDAAGNVSQGSTNLPIKVAQCSVDSTPPSTPSGLTGSASGTTVALHWNPSSDNVAVTAYDVLRNGSTVGSVTGAPPATTFNDSGLAGGTAYSYVVRARDAQGNISSNSNTFSVTTGSSCTSAICSVTQVTTDTDIPWGLATLSDGSFLYSERDAHKIIHFRPSTGQKTTVGTVPNVDETDGEGGLLGLAVSSNFNTDHWLYIMHTSPSDNRIVRIQVINDVLSTGTEQVLLSGLLRNTYHNGGRLRFGPDGKLYATTGDAQNGDNAQNLSSLNGKVLRINTDGTIPSDNPFGNAIWSYGHRNPQGLAFDSQGRLWEQEFGNSIMDETNLIQKGGNYGWPNCEGTSSQAGSGCGTAGYIAPKQTYPVANGSCSGIAIVRDVLYIACERGTRLYRETISGTSLANVQQFFVGTYGRLRTVEPTIDGNLWLSTTNNGDKDSIANNSNEQIYKVVLAP